MRKNLRLDCASVPLCYIMLPLTAVQTKYLSPAITTKATRISHVIYGFLHGITWASTSVAIDAYIVKLFFLGADETPAPLCVLAAFIKASMPNNRR